MDWLNGFGDLNWLAVLVAAASSFLVGGVWYSEGVFGRTWMRLVGIDPTETPETSSVVRSFVATGIASILTAIVLALLISGLGIDGWLDGLVFGLVIGLVIRGGAHVIHNGFARRPAELTVIDVAHDVVALALMGLILGAWQ